MSIRTALIGGLCLREYPSELVEKHYKPDVEMFAALGKESKANMLNPIMIVRTDQERCLIEPSINSVRVSLKKTIKNFSFFLVSKVSFQFKKIEELDKLICEKFSKFYGARADLFQILRRKPIPVWLTQQALWFRTMMWAFWSPTGTLRSSKMTKLWTSSLT